MFSRNLDKAAEEEWLEIGKDDGFVGDLVGDEESLAVDALALQPHVDADAAHLRRRQQHHVRQQNRPAKVQHHQLSTA